MLKTILPALAISFLTICQMAAWAQPAAQIAAASSSGVAETPVLPKLSSSAQQLAEQLHMLPIMHELQSKQLEYQRHKDSTLLIEIIALRQKLFILTQHAALEVEEALAGIDGDLVETNLLLAYVSAKRDRAVMLNNVATFVGAGSFGLLDSSTSIKLNSPTPQIFGIIGNSIATGLPLFSLHHSKYENPRRYKAEPNMLAPIFGRPYFGASYDPVVWKYIDSAAIEGEQPQSRRQLLLQRWRAYRGVSTITSAKQQELIDALVGNPNKSATVTPELLKTRAELLFDVRALVQLMYKDISELNSACLQL